MSLLRSILSSDLGEKNIPKTLIQSVAPSQLASLYWREQASQPANTIVEIWSLANNKFIVVSGNFSNGEWTQDDVELFGEAYDTISMAQGIVKSSFTFGPIEENTMVKEHIDAPPVTQEQPTTEQKAASLSKRLIRKK